MDTSTTELAKPPISKRKGCLITILIAAVVGLIVIVVFAVAVYSVFQTPDGKVVLQNLKSMYAGYREAPELRAAGCHSGFVLDATNWSGIDSTKPAVTVGCSVLSGTPPSCEVVAQTYLRVTKDPPSVFTVSVSKGFARKPPICEKVFDVTGALAKD